MWEAWRDKRKKLQRHVRKFEDDGFIHLIIVMFSRGYTYIKTYQFILFKYAAYIMSIISQLSCLKKPSAQPSDFERSRKDAEWKSWLKVSVNFVNYPSMPGIHASSA